MVPLQLSLPTSPAPSATSAGSSVLTPLPLLIKSALHNRLSALHNVSACNLLACVMALTCLSKLHQTLPNSPNCQKLALPSEAELYQTLPTVRSWLSPQKRRWNWLISMLLLEWLITTTHTLTHSVVAAPAEPMIHSTEARKLSSRWIPTMTVWSIRKSLQPQVAQRQISIVMI